MVGSRTVRDRLCDTDGVTDTRHGGARPRGPFAPTAAETAEVAGRRRVRHSGRPIAGITIAACPAASTLGATFEGWTAGTGARGGSLRFDEEVR